MHNRNQFEQKFQDSQANFSQAGAGLASQRGQGRPIQLLKVHPSGKIQLCQQALSLIASCQSEVGFVSIVGKMRTGKSCLLNRMLGLSGKGFRVDPSVSSCTQGIWIWSQPIFNENSNCLVFFMDTEGSQSLEKDAENDAKIFTLSLLISSYLVYNSVGSIDERSISDLQMVTALAHQVKTDEGLSQNESKQQLFRYMPKFIWLLRDFTLKVQDQYGRKITPTQYLENCLTDPHSSQSSKNVKKSLLTYFKDRDCITMVRPVGDQSQLQRLDSIPDHALRRQFVEVVGKLRDKLIKGCRPKNFGGEDVTGPAMVDMIEVFAEAFNSGKIPSIKSAWAQIAEDEGAKAYNLAISRYEQVFLQQFSDDQPKNQEQLRQALFKLRQQSMREFEENCGGKREHEQFRSKLRQLIDDKQAHIIQVNKNVCETHNHQILVNLSQEMKVKMASNSYKGNKKDLQSDFDGIIAKYNRQAKGATKAQILGEFVRTMNSAIFSMEDKPQQQDNAAERIRIEELQRLNKIKQKQMESLRKQLAAKENQLPVGGSKKENRKPGAAEKKTQGCCSGDKCLIM